MHTSFKIGDSVIMRADEAERASFKVFDVPGYMYKQVANDALRWMGLMLRGRSSDAFAHEIQLRFFAGFLGKRLTDQKANRARRP